MNLKQITTRYFSYKNFQLRNKNIILYSNNIIGGNNKKYIIDIVDDNIMDNKQVIFNLVYEEDNKMVLLTKDDNISRENSCVVILIDEENNDAYIDKIQTDIFSCICFMDFNLKNPGNFHLKIAIKMLKKYKDKFNINKITLTDNATVNCKNNSFHLSTYLLLIKGYTFYGKYGFKIKDKYIRKLETKYINYMKSINIYDLDWNDIFIEARKIRIYKKINDKIKNNFKKYIKNNPKNKLINLMNTFFNRDMMEKYSCELYLSIYQQLINFYQNKLGGIEVCKIFNPNVKILKL